MKTILLPLGLVAALAASAAGAQTTTAPQSTTPQTPVVAATLPNSFDRAQDPQIPTASSPNPTAAPASAPDIARAETALREVILALQSGQVDYAVFSDDLAGKLRPQAEQVGALLQQFGALKTMTHKGQPDGVDLFRVEFENQATEWVIGFDNDDQIAALLFRPAED